MDKMYLGDSVYAEFDADFGQVVLTTDNGYPDDPRNRIVLDSDVATALVAYIKERLAIRG